MIVTPWGTDYGDDALTRLTVHEDGSASGRCGIALAFMRVRHQRRDFLEPTADELAVAETTQTMRGGREWRDTGEPTPDRYGLTVMPDGTHHVWIDTPDSERSWILRP